MTQNIVKPHYINSYSVYLYKFQSLLILSTYQQFGEKGGHCDIASLETVGVDLKGKVKL